MGGGDASAALTSKVEVAGMKSSWKDTTWSESEIMESQKSKFANQTHSDIHVLDSKTIGPSSTHDKKREDPQFEHFRGSFQEHGYLIFHSRSSQTRAGNLLQHQNQQ